MQDPIKEKRIFFPNLDGLRFVAFLMVFLWHALKTPFELLHIENRWLQNLFYLFVNGNKGVSIFFVLSGFLITYLILAEIQVNGRLNIAKFFIRRGLRIWPLYFLVVLFVFGLVPILMSFAGLSWNQFDMNPWYYFLFLGNFDVLHIYQMNGTDLLPSTVTWSVAIEEQFYLVWPLLFAGIPSKFYKFIFPFLLIAAYTFRCLNAESLPILKFHTLSVCGDLALGGWIAYLSFTNKNFVDFFHNQSNALRLTLYCTGIMLLYLVQFSENDLLNAFMRLIQTIFFSYIILDQNFSGQNTFKFSNNRFLTFWGRYTYGLYLLHPLVLLTITLLVTKCFNYSLQHINTHLTIAILGFGCSMLVSYYSYIFIERHFLNLKKKIGYTKT